MTRISELPKILVIGPTPPPFHGVSMATEAVLHSALQERFRLLHLDLSDRRGIEHVDKPDLHDVALFVKQWWNLIIIVWRERPVLTYLPLSQSTIGFIRDSLLMLPVKLLGAQLVLHLHGGNFQSWYQSRSRLMTAFVRIVLRRVAYVIVLGESLRHLFDGLIAPYRVAVVPNGIHWPSIKNNRRSLHTKKRHTVLHLSTLNRLKGAPVLLAAVPLVLKSRQDVEFVFAGPWSQQEDRLQAEAFVLHHGLGAHVVFTGPVAAVEQKRSIYSTADLFVFPGIQQEGQPLVVLEAMASGLPVLYTNRGCLRETVIEGECGLEVRCNDASQLADRIVWCLNHPEEMERMGRNARERFERFYTSERFIRHLGDLFALASRGWRPLSGTASAGVGESQRHQVR